MKRCIALIVGLIVGQNAFAQSALEKAEKRIADLVTPGHVAAPPEYGRSNSWKDGTEVGRFDVPLKPLAVAPPKLLPSTVKNTKPRGVPEAPPLTAFRDESQGPQPIALPTKPLIRLPSVDTTAPLPIPILARPLVDRASLGEPAFESSLSAAMKPFMPARDRPVPFIAYNLPDPFEHVRYGQLRNPPEENATPPVMPMDRPTK